MESKKTCYVCGADVTHAERHKNREGKYRCSKRLEAKKQELSGRRFFGVTKEKLRLIIFCAVLAVAASWVFLRLLEAFNQPEL
jgi:hypothetical protein